MNSRQIEQVSREAWESRVFKVSPTHERFGAVLQFYFFLKISNLNIVKISIMIMSQDLPKSVTKGNFIKCFSLN